MKRERLSLSFFMHPVSCRPNCWLRSTVLDPFISVVLAKTHQLAPSFLDLKFFGLVPTVRRTQLFCATFAILLVLFQQ